MHRIISAFATVLVITSLSFSQPDESLAPKWKIISTSNLSLALNYYSDNWAGGDLGNLTWVGQTNTTAEKQFLPWLNSKNTLKLAFGQTKTEDKETRRWSSPVISTDLIDFETVERFPLRTFVDPYVSGRLISRFVDERDTSLTRYFNPIDITESFGAIRDIIKDEQITFSARIGAAARQLINRDSLDLITNTRNTETTNDGGFEVVGDYKQTNKAKWATFISQLKIYEAVVTSKDVDADTNSYWRYPDVNWDNTLSLSLNKFIMVQLYLQLLYDREIDQDARFKTTSSIGLTYSFSN